MLGRLLLRLSLPLSLTLGISPAVVAATPQAEVRTSMGTIVIDLYPDNSPKTVENFLRYVEDGFYDGTIFHRVMPGFMVQGGGFTRDMQIKPVREPIPNEAGNGLRNVIGTVSMARTKDPHSATAQFFINLANNDFLDFKAPDENGYGYTVFGRVSAGMDVVEEMVKVPTATVGSHQHVPRQPVVIEHVQLLGLAREARGKVSELNDEKFLAVVTAYRNAETKPLFPEEARRFRVQAEFAVERRRFADAVRAYGDALRVAPWWSQGYYNRSLVLAELRRYGEAIREMKRFLVLEPEHQRAREAQDQIYKWESLAR